MNLSPHLSLQPSDNEGLDIVLQGRWCEEDHPPLFSSIERQLRERAPARLRISGAGIEDWDSLLPTFLLGCTRYCAADDIALELDALPAGVERLLQVATTVPTRAGADGGKSRWYSLKALKSMLSDVGEQTTDSLAFTGAAAAALGRLALGRACTRWRDFRDCCYEAGPNALAIITLTSILVGMILAYLGAVQLLQFGAGIYVADLVAIGMLREMGALMTAVIIAGRTGAAYAAALGTMQSNEEIDAITTLGLSPMEFLVLPRILALVLMMPILTIYADLLGIVGGGIVAGSMGIAPLQYIAELENAISVTHFLVGLSKSILFALLIAVAGCRAGINAGRSSAAVGQATTDAVVTALVYLIVADAGMNILFQQLDI